MQLRSPPLVTAAASNNSLHQQNSACFATVRCGSPYRTTNLFFPLPRWLALPHSLAETTFRTHRLIYCAPLDSPGASRRQPLPTFNLHRARVRRAETASFKRLNRTRAEHRARLHVFAKTRGRLSTSVYQEVKRFSER